MNKPVSLGLPILNISKTVTYDFWYEYLKSMYQVYAKLYFMNTNNFIVYIKIFVQPLQMMWKKDLTKNIWLRPKKYSYIIDDDSGDGKS